MSRVAQVLLCIQLFESTAKTTTSVTKAVAASSAMLLVVTAQTVGLTVGSEDEFREGEHMPGRLKLRVGGAPHCWRRRPVCLPKTSSELMT
jgi:hypothetical protein